MARLFDNAQSEYLRYAGAPVTAMPLTMACWFYSDDNAAAQAFVTLSLASNPNHYYSIGAFGNVAGDPVRASIRDGGTARAASTSNAYAINKWQHACGVFTSTTSRDAYLNGNGKGSNTNTVNPTAPDRMTIGGDGVSPTPTWLMSGGICEIGIWNVALTDAEILSLYQRARPFDIRPNNLVAYIPLWRDEDKDFVGGLTITAYNTPSIMDHAPLVWSIPKPWPFKTVPLTATKTVVDTGAGADSVAQLLASLAVGDSGAGNDTLPGTQAGFALPDSGSGNDQLTQLLASLAVAESGAGADNLAQLLASLVLAESGAGADNLAVDTGGAATPPSTIGTASLVQNGNESGSTSVTVPEGADCVLLFGSWWTNSSNLGWTSLTLGGNAFTEVKLIDSYETSGNHGWIMVYRLNNPPAGSQTFAWDLGGTNNPAEGFNFYLVYLQDVDTGGDPIRDFDFAMATSDGGDQTLTTGSFSSDSNDLCLCGVYSYSPTSPNAAPTGSGQTEILDSGVYNSCHLAIGTKPGVSGSTTMTAFGNYPAMVAVSVKGIAGTGDQTKTVAEAGTGVDAIAQLLASFILVDTGAGADQLAPILASLVLSDSGVGSDSLTQLVASLVLAESGAGNDLVAQILANLTIADSGTGIDSALALILIAIADSGIGADTMAQILANLAVAESGTGGDSIAGLTVTLTVTDTGTGADGLAVLSDIIKTIADSGLGADNLAISVAPIAVADSGTGADSLGLTVTLAVPDTGAGLDLVGVLVEKFVTIAEAGIGLDSLGPITVGLAVPDTGAGLDLVDQINALLSVTDLGAGLDAAVGFDASISIVTITFTLAGWSLDFALATRSIDFALATYTVDFALATRALDFAIATRQIDFALAV